MSDAWMSETPNELHARLRRYEDVSCRQQNEIAALTARAERAEWERDQLHAGIEVAGKLRLAEVVRAEQAERERDRLRAAGSNLMAALDNMHERGETFTARVSIAAADMRRALEQG